MLCTFMAMFTQFDHPIVLKFNQHFNPNDQDSNLNFTKSNGLGIIY